MRYLILIPALAFAACTKEYTARDRAEAHCEAEAKSQPRLSKDAGYEALSAEKQGDKDFVKVCLQQAGYKD